MRKTVQLRSNTSVDLCRMTFEYLCRVALSLILLCTQLSTSNGAQQNLDVVLIGGTGDLAKRYLWKGYFNLFREEYNNGSADISLYGAGKSEVSTEAFQQILLQSISCGKLDTKCHYYREKFISLCQYRTLKSDSEYEKLCTAISSTSSDVIFYLSVPPGAYKSILQSIAKHCNVRDSSKNFKFTFEKPFGTDLRSAATLSSLIAKYLNEEQIYRVDHFLSDATVSQITDFRLKNPLIEQMMNHRYVKRVEIVASETVGCEGRTSYYDTSGVLRDMLQNHLTEILCLVTKNLEEPTARSNLLKTVSTVVMKDVCLAQYHGYAGQVTKETGMKDSQTSTFARVKLHIKNQRWRNTSVWLTSGKKMKGKNVYARIIFRKSAVSHSSFKDCGSAPQIVFVRCHSRLNTSAILISHSLPISWKYAPPGWTKTRKLHGTSVFGEKGKCFLAFVPNSTVEHAYVKVIANLHKGKREDFVPTDTLLESWRIWSMAVASADRMQHVPSYTQGSSLKRVLKLISEPASKRSYTSNIFLKKCDV